MLIIYILFKELSEIIISTNRIELQQNYRFAIGVKWQLPRQLLTKQFLTEEWQQPYGNIFHLHDVYMVKTNC